MLITPGQETAAPKRSKTLRRVVAVACCCLLLPPVCAAAVLARVAFAPLDIAPLARHFLPITLIRDPQSHKPALRLDVKSAVLFWPVFTQGSTTPIALSLRGNRLLAADGREVAHVNTMEATLDPFALVHSDLDLRTLSLKGGRLSLRRTQNEGVGLDIALPTTGGEQDGLAAVLMAMPGHVRVDDLAISLNDLQTGTLWTLSSLHLDLKTPRVGHETGLTGALAFNLAATDTKDGSHAPPTRLTFDAHSEPLGKSGSGTGAINWQARLEGLNPATLAPTLSATPDPTLSALDVPLTLNARLRLAPGGSGWLAPDALDILATLGAGHAMLAGSPFVLDHGTLDIGLALQAPPATPRGPSGTPALPHERPARLTLRDASLFLNNPEAPQDAARALEAHASGWLAMSDLSNPQQITGQVDSNIPRVTFADLSQYWPTQAAPGGKKWVTANIPEGTATNLKTSLILRGDAGWDSLDVTGLDGSLDATGLEVHWLRPISPLHAMNARLEIHDLKSLTISFDGGYQLVDRKDKHVGLDGTGRIKAGPGSMVISGLSEPIQTGIIRSRLEGRLEDVLALLAEPRLHLLSAHPMDITNPRGAAVIDLGLTLPLVDKVTIDDMAISAHADLNAVSLGNAVAGRSITKGRFGLDATADGMTLSGEGIVGGLPSTLSFFTDFRHVGPSDLLESAHLTSRLTPATVTAAGYDPADHFSGSADLDISYKQTGDKHGTVNVALDMEQARVRIPLWHKDAGRPAKVVAALSLQAGKITGVDRIVATGPDLDLKGQAVIRPHQPPELVVSAFRIARSSGRARLSLPGPQDPMIHVGVNADTLDLSPLVSGDPTEAKKQSPAEKAGGYHVPEAATGRLHGSPGRAWVIDLKARTLWYSTTRAPLRDVDAYFEDNGRRLEAMRFAMQGPTPVTMKLTPQAKERVLHVSIPDMGAFMTAFDILPDVKGGHATLNGTFDDSHPSAPFSGQIDVTPFTLTKAPTALRVARNISLYGWLATQDTANFQINRMSMPVTFQDGVLTIRDGSTGNTALGATLEGTVDLDHNSINLHGTVVPIFAVNTMPGKLPGIGKLFSPEKNGGLLAVTFGIAGKLNDPSLSFNPYSMLLPGLFRRMF